MPPPSPVPSPSLGLGVPMQRSVSSPGQTYMLPPSSVSYDATTPQPSQYLNLNGYRTSIPSIPFSSMTKEYTAQVIKPQNWFTMNTGQNIALDTFLAQYPMNVALPDALIRYMSGTGPAPSHTSLPGWMSKAQWMSRNVQPLSNPSPASSSMISRIEYIDPTDFSKVPWTYMDAKYALPAPGALPSCSAMVPPETAFQGMSFYVAAGI